MIERKRSLQPILCRLARTEYGPGVVDQNVNARFLIGNLGGDALHIG